MPPLLNMAYKIQTHIQSKTAAFIKQHPSFSGGMLLAFLLILAILVQRMQKYKKHGFTRRGKLRKKLQAVFRPIEGAEETSVHFKNSYIRKSSMSFDVMISEVWIETALGSVFNEQVARQLIEESFSEYLVSYSGPLKGKHLFKMGKKL